MGDREALVGFLWLLYMRLVIFFDFENYVYIYTSKVIRRKKSLHSTRFRCEWIQKLIQSYQHLTSQLGSLCFDFIFSYTLFMGHRTSWPMVFPLPSFLPSFLLKKKVQLCLQNPRFPSYSFWSVHLSSGKYICPVVQRSSRTSTSLQNGNFISMKHQLFLSPSAHPQLLARSPSTFCYFLTASSSSRKNPHFPDKYDKSLRVVPLEWPGLGQHPQNQRPESQGWVGMTQGVLAVGGAGTAGQQSLQSPPQGQWAGQFVRRCSHPAWSFLPVISIIFQASKFISALPRTLKPL